ncbi:DUF5325 family protein [Chengkuizengella axinellae]|uniref:DUF5325 family protein n=1 Tax=Chengkuizengella axinellae TaxID=3064388 RepID=A0ABT9IT52_9BACL|nr:DUF5325 family protein [Chengkuizengella sp. 2205SS18-9]MDP5272536.1 DUF5325 family protein [Chengkuizengella sp. 2205SS18-9]
MSKKSALLFSVIGVLFLVLTGVSLSYQQPLLALLFIFLSFFTVGIGFMVKAKTRKKE